MTPREEFKLASRFIRSDGQHGREHEMLEDAYQEWLRREKLKENG